MDTDTLKSLGAGTPDSDEASPDGLTSSPLTAVADATSEGSGNSTLAGFRIDSYAGASGSVFSREPRFQAGVVHEAVAEESDSSSFEAAIESPVQAEEIPLNVTNVNGSCKMGVELDILDIARRARNTQLNDKGRRRGACVVEFRNPKAFGSFFKSGHVTIMGAESVVNCQRAAQKYARLLRKLGYEDTMVSNFKITGIIAIANVGFHIKLRDLATKHFRDCSYEPELSSALTYYMKSPKVTCTVFSSGKTTFTGAKSMEDLHIALRNLLPILNNFQYVPYDL